MKDIVLFGIPGAGKWTQAELILEKYWEHFAHLSPGDVFRALVSKPNAIGDYATRQMSAWLLVDDNVTIGLFDAYFHAMLDDGKSMLLDWYPRSEAQLDAFLKTTKEYDRELVWIFFDLDEDEAIARMMSRAREWEDEAMMKIRLQEYYEKTYPVVQKFESSDMTTFVTIDASQSIEEIAQEVNALLLSK